jgi:hypothetical protein
MMVTAIMVIALQTVIAAILNAQTVLLLEE